ncbi:MAG: hypothetical protein WBV75_08955, partial [Robiginitalea sp.]
MKEIFTTTRHTLRFLLIVIIGYGVQELKAQQVSPFQTGHYSPAFSNVRDMARGAPGLAIVWYNQYMFSNKYADRDGNLYS